MGVPRAAEAWGAAAWTAGVRLGGSGSRGLWAYRGLQPGGGSELGGLWTWGGAQPGGSVGRPAGRGRSPQMLLVTRRWRQSSICHPELLVQEMLPGLF